MTNRRLLTGPRARVAALSTGLAFSGVADARADTGRSAPSQATPVVPFGAAQRRAMALCAAAGVARS